MKYSIVPIILARKNRIPRRKFALVILFSPHGLVTDGVQASVLKGRRLTACPITLLLYNAVPGTILYHRTKL
jgi:hypothetical protein